MIRRIGVAILVIAFVGMAGVLVLSWRRAIAPLKPQSGRLSLSNWLLTEKLSPRLDIARLATRVPGDNPTRVGME
jgi:hypothetical protein